MGVGSLYLAINLRNYEQITMYFDLQFCPCHQLFLLVLFYFLNFPRSNLWWSLCSGKVSTICSSSHLFLIIFILFVHILIIYLLHKSWNYNYFMCKIVIYNYILCWFYSMTKSVVSALN